MPDLILCVCDDDVIITKLSHKVDAAQLVGHKFVDHSDEVGASSVGTAPTTSSFST